MLRGDPIAADGAEPTASVVIPNYNHAHFLRRAVERHLAQTLAPFEIIVVDDASTDDSVAVATQLAKENPSVRLIRRAMNGGPNAGIRTGLSVAGGTYVTFAAADDMVEPTFMETSVDALVRYPEAAFSFLDPSRLHLGSDRIENVPLALAPTTRFFSPEDFESLFRRNSFTISSNTVVYRRAAIQAIDGFRQDLEWQADWMANLVLAFRHGAVYVPQALAHFVVNPASYGESNVKSAQGQRRMLALCLTALDRDYPDVAGHFRSAGLLPEMRARNLLWLAQSESGRRFLSPSLVTRLLLREVWTQARPFTPLRLRRWMRRKVAGR